MEDCPHCDGSGFRYDEERRRAYPCSCRPQRLARRRAAAVAGRIPKAFREVSFDREPLPSLQRTHPHVVREVRRFTDNLEEELGAGRGMWFTGGYGTGKTTLAMLISKTAMERDRTVAIYSLPRLLTMLRETFDNDSRFSLSALIDKLCSVDLLHIDDVGAEQSSPWALEQLYTVVNTRYEDQRSMVLTTNLIEQVRERPRDWPEGKEFDPRPDAELREQIGERTVSRLLEMCGEPLPMYGPDHRELKHFDLELPEPANEMPFVYGRSRRAP